MVVAFLLQICHTRLQCCHGLGYHFDLGSQDRLFLLKIRKNSGIRFRCHCVTYALIPNLLTLEEIREEIERRRKRGEREKRERSTDLTDRWKDGGGERSSNQNHKRIRCCIGCEYWSSWFIGFGSWDWCFGEWNGLCVCRRIGISCFGRTRSRWFDRSWMIC